ncbi:MAG: hypothetical protein ACI9VR_000709 [Cognaticolwellia sp.]
MQHGFSEGRDYGAKPLRIKAASGFDRPWSRDLKKEATANPKLGLHLQLTPHVLDQGVTEVQAQSHASVAARAAVVSG